MSIASNVDACFTKVIGLRVVGVVTDTLPRYNPQGTRALVFENGTALVIYPNGSFTLLEDLEVLRALRGKRDELGDINAIIRDLEGFNDTKELSLPVEEDTCEECPTEKDIPRKPWPYTVPLVPTDWDPYPQPLRVTFLTPISYS